MVTKLCEVFSSKQKNIHFIQADFSKINIYKADILYLYIPQKDV